MAPCGRAGVPKERLGEAPGENPCLEGSQREGESQGCCQLKLQLSCNRAESIMLEMPGQWQMTKDTRSCGVEQGQALHAADGRAPDMIQALWRSPDGCEWIRGCQPPNLILLNFGIVLL